MDKESTKKNYEIGFLCAEESGPQELVKFLTRSGAEILLEGPVEKIMLSYPIKKHSSAYFGYLHFAMEPETLKSLEHDLNTHAAVLRYLVITPPFEKQKPRPMGRPRGPRAVGEPSAPEKKQVPAEALPLSNEALEKKIEEILQQ